MIHPPSSRRSYLGIWYFTGSNHDFYFSDLLLEETNGVNDGIWVYFILQFLVVQYPRFISLYNFDHRTFPFGVIVRPYFHSPYFPPVAAYLAAPYCEWKFFIFYFRAFRPIIRYFYAFSWYSVVNFCIVPQRVSRYCDGVPALFFP